MSAVAPVVELSMGEIGAVVVVSIGLCTALFYASWVFGHRFHPRFTGPLPLISPRASKPGAASVKQLDAFDLATKGDFCSRVVSTVHCVVVVIGLIAAMPGATYDDTMSPIAGDLRPLQGLLCFSFGYFTYDLIGVVVFVMPLWGVFVAHHIAAMLAIGCNIFNPPCRHGTTLCIALFLLVEIATIPLNAETFAEQFGWDDRGRWRTLFFYSTVVSWALTRVVLPIVVLYLILTRVVLTQPPGGRACMIPGVAAAFYLAVFCVVVFFGMFVPKVIQRWRPTVDDAEVALQEVPPV